MADFQTVGFPGVGVNAPFSDFSVVPDASTLHIPVQPAFAQWPTPAAFSAPSSGGTFFNGLGSNGGGYPGFGGYPSVSPEYSFLPTIDGMIIGAGFGAPFGPVGVAIGGVVGGLAGSLYDPNAIGVPGIDPSAGAGGSWGW